jgi:hypothetical protein
MFIKGKGSLDVEWIGVLQDGIHSRGLLNRVMELGFR